jgi:hypothetical protein
MSVTIPARFVNPLRVALLSEFSSSATEIADCGQHPTGFDASLLEPFDAYRALLEVVGWVRKVPAAQVEVDLSVHRWVLETALRERLDLERYFTKVDPASGQYRRARRRARQIEAFMASAGLESAGVEGGDE